MDAALLKMKKFHNDVDTVTAFLSQIRKDVEMTELERTRAEKAALAGLEAMREQTRADIKKIFSERIETAKEAQLLKPTNSGLISDTLKLLDAIGDASPVQINSILSPLKGDNAALTLIHQTVRNSGKVKPETMAQVNWGVNMELEVQRHEIMQTMCLDGLKNMENAQLEYVIAKGMFAESLGYASEG